MTIKNHIEGVITLSTAMHVCEFDKPGEMMQKPIITAEGRFYMPYFPANDLRGRLRRKAAYRIFAIWKKKGLTIPETLYLGMTCGVSSGNPENTKSVAEIVRANQNVYMGVFGGGTRMLRSGYRIQDLDVISQTCIDAGIVPSRLGESTVGGYIPVEYKDGKKIPIREGFKLLHTYNILRVDDIMRAVRIEEMESLIVGGNEAIAAYQTSVLTERSENKAAKDIAKETGIAAEKVARNRVENMQNFRAVAPGTPFYLRIDMADTLSSIQTGLLILCLRDLFEEGEFGGYVRLGLGKVAIREMRLMIDGISVPLFDDELGLKFSTKVSELAILAEEAVGKLSVEEMNLFFISKGG
jgi:CRISPR type IV-associated protein Csf2